MPRNPAPETIAVPVAAETLAQARARARMERTTVVAVLRAHLEAYAEGQSPAQQLGARGGAARRKTMTAEQRSASARAAATARWAHRAL
jgi:hypothetical protein